MLLQSSRQPINCDWCLKNLLIIFAENLFFFKSNSNCSLLVLRNAISNPENIAEASNENITIEIDDNGKGLDYQLSGNGRTSYMFNDYGTYVMDTVMQNKIQHLNKMKNTTESGLHV